MSFQFSPLAENEFSHLYGLSDETLMNKGVLPYIADSKPGYPCRVTLDDAEPGERLLLLNYTHLSSNSPYHSSHAIFIKDGATAIKPEPNEVPKFVSYRMASIRAFDDKDMMLELQKVKLSQLLLLSYYLIKTFLIYMFIRLNKAAFLQRLLEGNNKHFIKERMQPSMQ